VSDYYQEIDKRRPSQGDIVELAPHSRLVSPIRYVTTADDGSITVGTVPSGEAVTQTCLKLALLLTPDCELAKPKTRFWHICPIHPLAQLNRSDQGNTRKNKIFNFLYLPAFKTMPDSFVDLSWITTLEAPIIDNANRLMTLSDMARAALYMQQIRWISRWILSDVKCPRCQLQFNAADTLPVRSE